MNGQETPLSLSKLASANGSSSNGAPSSSIHRTSWMKEIAADPDRAAQVGLISQDSQAVLPSHNYAASLMALHGYSPAMLRSMMAPSNPMQTLGDGVHPLASAMAHNQHQPLLMPSSAVTSSLSTSSFHPKYASGGQESLPPKHAGNVYANDIQTKRVKMDEGGMAASLSYGNHVSMAPSAAATSAPTRPAEHSIPHRPDYFHKGSVIQLGLAGGNNLKRIEDLRTADFKQSAESSSHLRLDCSTVTNIVEDPDRGTSLLTFSVGDNVSDQVCAHHSLDRFYPTDDDSPPPSSEDSFCYG